MPTHPWHEKEQEKHGSYIKKNTTKDPESIELTDIWKKILINSKEELTNN